MRLRIKVLDREFSLCTVADWSAVDLNAPFTFIGKTDEENSLVCETARVPAKTTERDDGWRGFRIVGVLDFSLIGILSRIATVLAEAKIGIFAVSTFNTDYVFVKSENFVRALDALAAASYEVESTFA